MNRWIRSPSLAPRLRRVLALLGRVQPDSEDGDVIWSGPYFLPGRRKWWPTRFLRYRDELYCSVEIGWSTFTLDWRIGSAETSFQGQQSSLDGWWNGPELWALVLEQVEHRLRRALADPDAYNRRVARLLPLECRTGHVRRVYTWPRSKRPMRAREIGRLELALARGERARPWRELSVRRYLEVAALAYDSVFDELRELTPLEKYERKADNRHGGMLDLPEGDARAFERWHSSREWLGTHPWEIVFAHPHGVLLSPHREGSDWRFFLSVDTLGLYVATARMAIALGEGDVPFELLHAPEVIAALRGEDRVEVGPFHGQLSLEELESRRKGASAHVEWDAPPILAPRRSASREKTGTRSRRAKPAP